MKFYFADICQKQVQNHAMKLSVNCKKQEKNLRRIGQIRTKSGHMVLLIPYKLYHLVTLTPTMSKRIRERKVPQKKFRW